PNSVLVDKYFNTEGNIALGLNGLYQSLRSGDAVGEGANTWTDDRSDDMNTTDNQSNNGEPFQFTAFALTPSNTWLKNHYYALYLPIYRANELLGAIDTVSFASASTKAQYIGEMKFVRAFMYFQLVREFGDVPLSVEALTGPAQANALTVRATRKQVYDQIIKDLKEALESPMPAAQTAATLGRGSKRAANGLLGKVYLTMAATGVDNNRANFEAAKTYLLACMNQRTYGVLNEIPYASVFDVAQKTTNRELIWQIPYIQGDQNYSSAIARNTQARGETVNSRFSSTGAGWLVTDDFRKEVETGDLRGAFTFKYAPDASVQQYFITKFRDNSAAAGTLGRGGNDWILMRYADIMLSLAEAHMHLGEVPQATALLNEVRTRAGLPTYAASMANPAYATKFTTLKLALLHERRMELAFEHHRWHDLVRFFNPDELVAYFRAKNQGDYNNSPLTNISTKDYFFPIPIDEMNINPGGMTQNAGY
ncbi:MAG: RagB/SusD family nutrient uptake outer membrane protein, partial [Sphingobacteriales bacterium]